MHVTAAVNDDIKVKQTWRIKDPMIQIKKQAHIQLHINKPSTVSCQCFIHMELRSCKMNHVGFTWLVADLKWFTSSVRSPPAGLPPKPGQFGPASN